MRKGAKYSCSKLEVDRDSFLVVQKDKQDEDVVE